MRFSEIIAESNLTELGNKPYPFKIDPGGTKDFKVIATKDGKIEVLLEGVWTNKGWAIDIKFTVDGTTDMTGKGDQFRIFSTVAQILKKRLPPMINQLGPSEIWFHAHNNESSRVSLYDKYAVRFFNQLLGPHWKFGRSVGDVDTRYEWIFRPNQVKDID